jgi:hypothetical protein
MIPIVLRHISWPSKSHDANDNMPTQNQPSRLSPLKKAASPNQIVTRSQGSLEEGEPNIFHSISQRVNSYSLTNANYISNFDSKGIATNMNVITSTCHISRKKTTIHIVSKIRVNGMKGDSELTIMPNYLAKEVCHSLATMIWTSEFLRQYFQKRKKSDDMQLGWKEPCLMIVCHEGASSVDLSDFSPGYGYRDVRISGILYDGIPGLQKVAEQFAKECGVPC